MENIDLLRKEIGNLNDENARLKVKIKKLEQERNTVRVSHEVEANYQESQVRFRTIFETSKLGNKVISSDLKILQVNAAMVGLLGYDHKEEIIGTRILDYAPAEFHAHWRLLQKKLWETNMPSFTLETCLRKKDGTIIWCQVNSILFSDHGEVLGYTIIEDITEQHELKKQRENFISIASHELKTPLTSLQGYLQVMHRMIQNDTTISDKLIQLSENSKRSISKLSSLVGDLLDSTKINKGQLYLNVTNFNLSEMVDRCCSHVRLDEKYQITFKGDPSLKISADEQKIEQVLVNFVNNAIKYAPQSKEIIIEIEDLNDKVKISVIDSGEGIPKDKLPYLFNSYYQVSNVEKTTQGLGLGLYISSEIIKRHHGEIGVDSEIGQGSTFWFTIPKST
jgi:PAS domain S-box-containing protein